MTALLYTITFLLAVFSWGLFVWKKKKRFLLVPAIVCTVLFGLALVWDNAEEERQFEQVGEENDQEYNTIGDDRVLMHQEAAGQRSAYQKKTAAYERDLLAAYDWNRQEADVLQSGNLALAPDIFRNVALGLIGRDLDYDLFYHKQDFEDMIAGDPTAYIGKYCEVIYIIEDRGICADDGLLSCFPQIDGFTVVQKTGVYIEDDSTHILFLDYMQESGAQQNLENMPIGERWQDSGIYFGTYTMNGTLYYVFANYAIGG